MASHSSEPTEPQRRTSRLGERVSRLWARWWVKALVVLGAIGLLLLGGGWFFVTRDLPSVEQLRTYEPPLPTNVRGIDGAPIYSYARERR